MTVGLLHTDTSGEVARYTSRDCSGSSIHMTVGLLHTDTMSSESSNDLALVEERI